MNARIALLIVAAMTLPERAGAQDARPVRFWVSVTDFIVPAAKDQLHQYALTHDLPAVPTSLMGWACKATAPSLEQYPATKADAAFWIPAMPASLSQKAEISCVSKSGTVKAQATCRLTAENESGFGEIDLTDAAGHTNWVSVGCRNWNWP